MKRFLSQVVAGLSGTNPRSLTRPNHRVGLRFDVLEGRSLPSFFLASIPASVQFHEAHESADDVIVGSGAGAPGGHVKA